MRCRFQNFIFSNVRAIIQSNKGSQRISLKARGEKLDRKDWIFSKSDPFYMIFSDGQLVVKSQTLQNTLNPNWPTAYFNDTFITTSSRIRIEVYDADPNGGFDLIGTCSPTETGLISINY